MKPLIGSALALALFSTASLAQVAIDLTPEQRTMVWQQLRPPSQKQPATNFELGVSTTIPETVELHPVPANFAIASLRPYRYVIVNNRMAFIDPSSRKVVHIIER
jgi:hypothetical protein